jgi:hypothetical protein
MPRIKKFNFMKILVGQPTPEQDAVTTLSISKGGQMVISPGAVRKWGLDGSLVDIVWDPSKRALGMRRLNGVNLAEDKYTKTMRLLKQDTQTGQIRVAIGRILTSIGVKKDNYKRLPIDQYNDLMEKFTIYFVELPKEALTNNKNGELESEEEGDNREG